MNMQFRPTPSGGRALRGHTSFGAFEVEWDVNGKLLSEHVDIWSPDTDKAERKYWLDSAARIGTAALSFVRSFTAKKAERHVVDWRSQICSKCEYSTKCLVNLHCCGRLLVDAADPESPTCGCVIERKVKVAAEHCPLDDPKW